MHKVGNGVWGEKWKMLKMRRKPCRTWNMARNLNNVGNEAQTLCELEYGEKLSKKVENEKYTL